MPLRTHLENTVDQHIIEIQQLKSGQKTLFNNVDEIKKDVKDIKDSQIVMAQSLVKIDTMISDSMCNSIKDNKTSINTLTEMCADFSSTIKLHAVEVKKIPFLQKVCWGIMGVPIFSGCVFGVIKLL